jgi:hypothetical protein
MGWIKTFPKCKQHEAGQWDSQTYGKGGPRWWRYAASRCVHCGRPLVSFAPNFPEADKTSTRRYVAWHYLDKEGEHASNVSVMPWGSECFAQRMHRTVNETLQ